MGADCSLLHHITFLTKLHLKLQTKDRLLHTENTNIIVAFLVFMLRFEICKFQRFVEIYCRHLQGD